jgi:hypothetical protein
VFAEFYSKNLRASEQKGVPVAPLRAVLEKLGAAQTAVKEIPKRLSVAGRRSLSHRRQQSASETLHSSGHQPDPLENNRTTSLNQAVSRHD